MADAYDAASQNINEQKQAMLSAAATAGAAGLADYQAAQQQVAQQRDAAISQALAKAAVLSTPQAGMDQIRSSISAPYDARLQQLGANQASHAAMLSARQGADESYFAKAQSAIPGLRTFSQAAAAKLASDQAIAAQRNDLEMQKLQLEVDKAKADAAGGNGGPLAAIIKAMGGVENANRYLSLQGDRYVAGQQDRALTTAGGHGGTLEENKISTDPSALRDQFDQATGLPGGYSNTLSANAKAPAKENGNDVLDLAAQALGGQNSKGFAVLQDLIANAKSYNDALTALAANKVKTPGGNPLSHAAIQFWLKRYADAAH